MTTITWNVHNLERESSDGYVFRAHYRVNAVDDKLLSTHIGTVRFKKPDTLIPYDDLTESQVLKWIKSKVDHTAIEASLNEDIAKKKAPATAKGLPWAKEEQLL